MKKFLLITTLFIVIFSMLWAQEVPDVEVTTTKAKLQWNKNSFEIDTKIPFSIDMETIEDVSLTAMVQINIADVPIESIDGTYELTAKGKHNNKWEYKDKKYHNGNIKEFKVEGKLAKFDWKDKKNYGKLHFHTHSISDVQTIFCIHSSKKNWPMTVSVGDGVIEYDELGEVTTLLKYEAQKNKNTHIHYNLDFKLDIDTKIVVNMIDHDFDILTSDFYEDAYVKCKVKGIFQDAITSDITPAIIDYTFSIINTFPDGELGTLTITDIIGDDEEWKILNDKKWDFHPHK